MNPTPKFFLHLRRVLGLTLVQEVVLAIGLRHSKNPEIRVLALENICKQLPDLIKNYTNSENNIKQQEEGLHDSSPEVLHLILFETLKDPNFFGLAIESKEKFLKNLRRDFPRELVPVVLAPLLYPGDEEYSHIINDFDMASNQMVSYSIIIKR